jgi:hypothetical protein
MWISPQTMPLYETQHEKFICPPFSCSSITEPIQLDFSELTVFEPVQDHYQQQGIRFEGAIALRPSNPAFNVDPVDPTAIALAPEAGRSSIAVHFEQLQRLAGALVTATQKIKLTLFNQANEPIAEQYAGATQYVQGLLTADESFPQHYMELIEQGIAKVEFSSDAPFILHRFFYA